ncbi:tyrosine-type recombinase/integrase [Anaerosolibacter sp.]|uniref:tyrosine-type recombinase/integrase n=1 Tax=Anaerosolibacter sp. TaxID=1872527 RepID=UPI0039F13177
MHLNQSRNHELTQRNEVEYVEFNDTLIRVGIKGHFNRKEIQAYGKSKFQFNLSQYPLDYYLENKNLRKLQKTYSFTLAFYRRISLPLESSLSAPISWDKYPVSGLRNFQTFDELFEKYYASFQKLDTENQDKRDNFKNKVAQVVLKLWLSGYGILPNYTDNCIDDDLLIYLRERKTSIKKSKSSYAKISRFLGYILSNEDSSPVSKIPKMFSNTSLKDREIGKWNQAFKSPWSVVTHELYNFTFGSFRDRIRQSTILEYTDNTGTIVRESQDPITEGTWVGYSLGLQNLAKLSEENGYNSIQELLPHGLIHIFTDGVYGLAEGTQEFMKTATRHWLNWYTKRNNINLNIYRILPVSVRNKERSFGRILNLGAAVTLLEVLLDDNSTYFNDNDIRDFRARRACLLQIATGQRASEICFLLYDCIAPDNMGVVWLVMHKTKTEKVNLVPVTQDIRKWVDELRANSPEKKILIAKSEYPAGDDLEERRLLANQFDEGPFTYSSINDFLERIQKQIWPNGHPNKTPLTSHDFRSLHALYMRQSGKTKDEIKDQLGHSSVNSQLPYLATKPLAHQENFKKIRYKGIYKNITNKAAPNAIEVDKIIEKTSDLSVNKYDKEKLINIITTITADVDNFIVPKPINSPLPTGFPLRIHSCNASTMINCGRTELHCFPCKLYKPDLDTLLDHKTEVFRYMVLCLYQSRLAKNTKDILERQIVQVRTHDITALIDKTFDDLFPKFNLPNNEVISIRSNLQQKAEQYLKKYYKNNPNPSFIEAKTFLQGGEING